MGTWGIDLYSNDTVADLRDDFRNAVRAPWDGERLLAWALEKYPEGTGSTDEEYSNIRLVLADLFWTYGIDHPATFDLAFSIVADGVDLAAKQALGMSDRDLARRAKVLGALVEKWRTPNPKPRSRRMVTEPEPFVLNAGDCVLVPTSAGHPRNPYVTPGKEESYYARYPWNADGWAAIAVLARYHRYGVFARYLACELRKDPEIKPPFADFPSMSIRSTASVSGRVWRRLYPVSTTKQHLARMRVEVVGTLAIDQRVISHEFIEIAKPVTNFDGTDLANRIGDDLIGQQELLTDDPLAKYLA